MHIDTYAKDVFNGASTLYTFWTSPFVLEFLFGSFVGYYFDKRRIKYLIPIVLIIAILLMLSIAYQSHYMDSSYVEGYYLPFRVLFLGVISMLVLAMAVELNKRDIIILPTFSIFVGGASYSLYLAHNIILLFLYQIGVRNMILDFGKYQLLFMLIIVLAMVVYSVLHYKYLEIPVMAYVKSIKQGVLGSLGIR